MDCNALAEWRICCLETSSSRSYMLSTIWHRLESFIGTTFCAKPLDDAILILAKSLIDASDFNLDMEG